MDVEKVFANVTGRKMTPDEVTRYLKFQKEFEVPDTDPFWMIFIWFEFYQRIFEQFPEKARVEAEGVARSLRDASVKVTEATTAEVKAARGLAVLEITDLQEKSVIEINKTKEKAKGDIASALGPTLTTEIGKAVVTLSLKTTAKKWLSIGVSVAGIVVTAGILGAYVYGAQNGPIFGAMEKSYRSLVACSDQGWKKQKRVIDGEIFLVCFPYAVPDGTVNGWTIQDLGGVSPSGNSP